MDAPYPKGCHHAISDIVVPPNCDVQDKCREAWHGWIECNINTQKSFNTSYHNNDVCIVKIRKTEYKYVYIYTQTFYARFVAFMPKSAVIIANPGGCLCLTLTSAGMTWVGSK